VRRVEVMPVFQEYGNINTKFVRFYFSHLFLEIIKEAHHALKGMDRSERVVL
jgi:hypothetical protein